MALQSKHLSVSALAVVLCLGFGVTPARAESINQDAKEQVNWYSASRQMQICDDRPFIKDLRTLPKQEQTIEIPGQLTAEPAGGIGAGCVNSNNSETIPRGGIHLGNPGLAFRAPRIAESSGASTGQRGTLLRPASNAIPSKAPSMTSPLPRPPKGSLLRPSQPM